MLLRAVFSKDLNHDDQFQLKVNTCYSAYCVSVTNNWNVNELQAVFSGSECYLVNNYIIAEIFVRSTSIHAKLSYICMHASSDNVVPWESIK